MGYWHLGSAFPPWTPRGWQGNLEPEETRWRPRRRRHRIPQSGKRRPPQGRDRGAGPAVLFRTLLGLGPLRPGMSALRLTPGRQVPMASPPPMGVLGVIMGNVVPGERACTRSQTTIPDRPHASASPHAEPARGRCVPNGSRGGSNSVQPGFTRSPRGVSDASTPRAQERVRGFRTRTRARRALLSGGSVSQLRLGW